MPMSFDWEVLNEGGVLATVNIRRSVRIQPHVRGPVRGSSLVLTKQKDRQARAQDEVSILSPVIC